METIRWDKTCRVVQENTGKSVMAEVVNLKDKQRLIVNINNAANMTMIWNGKVYEGRLAGMDFVSSGPEVYIMKDNTQGRYHR